MENNSQIVDEKMIEIANSIRSIESLARSFSELEESLPKKDSKRLHLLRAEWKNKMGKKSPYDYLSSINRMMFHIDSEQ
jgi:hypothetical protein